MDLGQLYIILSWILAGVSFGFGVCFLVIHTPNNELLKNYNTARKLVAYAYIAVAIIYTFELLTRAKVGDIVRVKQLLSILTGTIQALLFTYTLITLINTYYVNRRKIIYELSSILLLSIITFLVLLYGTPKQFGNMLRVFSVYYIFLMTWYTMQFFRQYRRYRKQLDNYYSEREADRLRWVKTAFLFALLIGILALVSSIIKSNIMLVISAIIFIFFRFYFGIQLINYAFLFREIQPVIMEDLSLIQENEKAQTTSDTGLEEKITYWIQEKGFAEKGITIDQISQELNITRSALSSYLNTIYKQPFSAWINNLRIEEAKALLLKEPDLPVGEIGAQVGYSDKSNFGRQFSKSEGISPSAWRKSQME